MTNRIIKIHDRSFTPEDLKTNEAFCVLPWIHFHAWPDGKIYPCCQTNFRDTIDQYQGQSFNDIMNNDEFKKMRLNMLNGRKPMKYCNYCFKVESFGQDSPRNHKNNQMLAENFESIKQALESTQEDGSIDFKMRYYDIRFSNICNLKCRSCGPNLSSTWASEALSIDPKGLMDYPNIKKNGIIKINDISKNVLDDILNDTTLSDVQHLYFAGGEPLVSSEHYQILEGLIRLGNTNAKIMYNTNFTKLSYAGKDVLDLWAQFPNLHVGTSVDDIGERLFYIRGGAVWEDVVRNYEAFHNRIQDSKWKIYNSITVSLMNVYYLPEIIAEFFNKGLVHTDNDYAIHLNMVFDPDFLAITALPPNVKQLVQERLEAFMNTFDFKNERLQSNLKERVKYTIDLMISKDCSNLLPKTADYLFKFDKIRNENFLETFKELNEHLKLESYVNQDRS